MIGLIIITVLTNCKEIGLLEVDQLSVGSGLFTVKDMLKFDQSWNMFAPAPVRDDGW